MNKIIKFNLTNSMKKLSGKELLARAMKPKFKKNDNDADDKGKRHKKNWIAGAIKHPGALHRELGVKAGSKIPAKKLRAAASKGGKLGRRARLAETLKGFHKSKTHRKAAKGKPFVKNDVKKETKATFDQKSHHKMACKKHNKVACKVC